MNLETILITKHSKSTTNEVIRWVGNDEKRFKELIHLVLGSNKLIAQRAAWPMSYLVIDQPKLIYPYLYDLLELVKQPVHPAIKRNTFRFLKEIDIPENCIPKTLETCFNAVGNPKEPVAVICFAFYTLLNLGKKFPELKNEILFATELHQENESAGIKHMIKKLRKNLN